MCAFLPLALRIAAANLTDRARTIAGYVAELRASNRLAALAVDGDEQAAVRPPSTSPMPNSRPRPNGCSGFSGSSRVQT